MHATIIGLDLAKNVLHDEIAEGYRDMIHAEIVAEVEKKRKALLRNWRQKCKAVADSLKEAGDRLFTFTRLDPAQWKAARASNAIERLNEEFRKRLKTPTVLPCAETVPMLFWAPLASGQITMRKLDGWQTLDKPIEAMPLNLAARSGSTQLERVAPDRILDSRCDPSVIPCLQADIGYQKWSNHILLSCVNVPCGLSSKATRTPRRRGSLCVSIKFVNDMVRLGRETGSLAPKRHGNPGRGKLTGVTDRVQRRITAQPDLTIDELTAELAADHELDVHRSSVGRLLLRLGLSHKVRRIRI